MSKFDKAMGRDRPADTRRSPVPDDPNKVGPRKTRKDDKPYVLRVVYSAPWSRKKEWVLTSRYATPESRAQARQRYERIMQADTNWKPIRIEEFER